MVHYRKIGFHDIIFSMKSSNSLVMIAAYRLLVQEMGRLGWDYPLHLGVTEAGAGEEGRVKSAVGIGSLLFDGLGDTIRVSLTEDPWKEIDPARRLVTLALGTSASQSIMESPQLFEKLPQKERVPLPLQRKVRFETDLPLNQEGSVLLETTAEILKPDLTIKDLDELCRVTRKEKWPLILKKRHDFILFAPKENRVHEGRKFFHWLQENNITIPVILDFAYEGSFEDLVIHASAECGALLSDGLGEGILLRAAHSPDALCRLSFSILQACRKRLTKTEFISCPGCERTLFDLQEVSKRIRQKTTHLPGVKIAIMGCVVNGPGEMADADFGYVGLAKGKIDLYVGKKCVERGIDSAIADEKLISLIKAYGRWIDPD